MEMVLIVDLSTRHMLQDNTAAEPSREADTGDKSKSQRSKRKAKKEGKPKGKRSSWCESGFNRGPTTLHWFQLDKIAVFECCCTSS